MNGRRRSGIEWTSRAVSALPMMVFEGCVISTCLLVVRLYDLQDGDISCC